jgi:peptidoglycan/xylan/chitin deacetylase (PgdA/CDA1 family)
MKVIISHDVDHITVSEHLNDLIIPKHLVRMQLELFLSKISFKEYYLRYTKLLKNKWNNIVEIIDFNEKNNIPATFFVGVNNGVGLNYNLDLAAEYIYKIVSRGFDCGVHGIAFEQQIEIQKEYNTFKEISGLENFGIRMHYLRNDPETIEKLANAGYTFDSTVYGIKQHYSVGNMLEFPLHIMEGYELEAGKKYQSQTWELALQTTISKIKLAQSKNIEYLTILFHDRYFDDSYLSWKIWYEKVVEYCKAENLVFVSYKEAIDAVNKSSNIKIVN